MGPWEKRKGMSFQYKDKAEYKEDNVLCGRPKGLEAFHKGAERRARRAAEFLTQFVFSSSCEMWVQDA